MKPIEGIILIVLIVILTFAAFFAGKESVSKQYNMPEEIMLLSKDFQKPDTLIGYQINGVITIGFKH